MFDSANRQGLRLPNPLSPECKMPSWLADSHASYFVRLLLFLREDRQTDRPRSTYKRTHKVFCGLVTAINAGSVTTCLLHSMVAKIISMKIYFLSALVAECRFTITCFLPQVSVTSKRREYVVRHQCLTRKEEIWEMVGPKLSYSC